MITRARAEYGWRESDAVILILENARQRQWQWVSSQAVGLEVARISDSTRWERIQLVLGDCDEWQAIGTVEGKRTLIQQP